MHIIILKYMQLYANVCKSFFDMVDILRTLTRIYIYTMYYIYHTMYFLYSVNSCYLDAEVLMFHGHLG